ncbi:unnamed protein product [Lampetra fluviatilis]
MGRHHTATDETSLAPQKEEEGDGTSNSLLAPDGANLVWGARIAVSRGGRRNVGQSTGRREGESGEQANRPRIPSCVPRGNAAAKGGSLNIPPPPSSPPPPSRGDRIAACRYSCRRFAAVGRGRQPRS